MQETDRTMDRQYKAFISYRHKPLDMEYARKLHRRIERYTIPSELRKEGEKKLGLVFRDQDELPIANNLTQNITAALDNSEYLIVICSPDTPQSEWVRREIDYFIRTHDRDHVLALLVSGNPEESFPAHLTEVRDADGKLVERIEPLAANIAASSPAGREKLFKTESLRILASLIGCPYDALYRREQRYRMQRMGALFGTAILILAAFIGLLLNRNAKIEEQLKNALIKESTALAALSESDFRNGNYRSALDKALSALPGKDQERPYVAAAEYALAKELYLYQRGNVMRYTQSFEQDGRIARLAVSEDGSLLATGDLYGNVRVSDTVTGEMLWEAQTGDMVFRLKFSLENRLFVESEGTRVFDGRDGSLLWEDEKLASYLPAGNEGLLFFDSLDKGILIRKADPADGRTTAELADIEKSYLKKNTAAISPDGRYAAVFYDSQEGDKEELVIYDFLENTALQAGEYPRKGAEISYSLNFGPDNILFLTVCGEESFLEDKEDWEGCFMELLDPAADFAVRFHEGLDPGTAGRSTYGLTVGVPRPDYIGIGSDCIVVAIGNHLLMVDQETGRTLWDRELPGYVKTACLYNNDSMGLVLSTGDVTVCTKEGKLGLDVSMGCYRCDFDVHAAAAGGSSFRRTCFALVPSEDPFRAAAVGFCEGKSFAEDAGLEAFPFAGEDSSHSRLFVSPSEKYVAGIQSADQGYKITLMDPSGEKPPQSFTEEKMVYSDVQGARIFVTDDGKVIAGVRVIDPAAGTVTYMTEDSQPPERLFIREDASCILSGDGTVLTGAPVEKEGEGCSLRLWKNGREEKTIPVYSYSEGHLFRKKCCALNADRYALVLIQWEYNDPGTYLLVSLEDGSFQEVSYLDPLEEETLAMAETRPWMALQDTEGTLSLIDLPGGQTICSMDSPLPPSAVKKILFANEDKWLLAFTDGGSLAIFDTGDGSLLYYKTTVEENLSFDAESRYQVYLVPEQNRLLIIYDDYDYTETACISIDTVSFESNGLYNGPSVYLKTLDRMLVVPYYDVICQSQLFSLEKIREMGEVFLEKGLPGRE